MKLNDVCVIGAGISGLGVAYVLNRAQRSVAVIESSSRVGGVIESGVKNSFLLEYGPQTCLLEPEIKILLQELNLKDQIVISSPQSKHRYLGDLRDSTKLKLKPIPSSPQELLFGSFLSFRDKCTLLKELISPHSKHSAEDISLYDIFQERLGRDLTEGPVSAAYLGVWASRLSSLGAKEVSPHLYDAYISGESILKASIQHLKSRKKECGKYEIGSLKNGLSSLTDSLIQDIGHDNLLLNSRIQNIEYHNKEWHIETISPQGVNTKRCKALIISTPAKALHDILKIILKGILKAEGYVTSEYENTLETLNAIPYAPMGVLHAAIPKSKLNTTHEGFGALIPPGRSKALLGVIFTSSIFPERSPEEYALFTCFTGGDIYSGFSEVDKKPIQDKVLEELKDLLGTSILPEYVDSRFWPEAIPKYGVEYSKVTTQISRLVREQIAPQKNLYISSNIMSGVSIPSRIRNAFKDASLINLRL